MNFKVFALEYSQQKVRSFIKTISTLKFFTTKGRGGSVEKSFSIGFFIFVGLDLALLGSFFGSVSVLIGSGLKGKVGFGRILREGCECKPFCRIN